IGKPDKNPLSALATNVHGGPLHTLVTISRVVFSNRLTTASVVGHLDVLPLTLHSATQSASPIHIYGMPTYQACEQEFIKPANYYSPRTLIHELLEALSFVRFRYVDVPLGIGRNIVRAVELTGPVSTASELANNL